MRSVHLILATTLLFSTGAVGARERLRGEARLAQVLEGRVAGKPVNCISLGNARSSEIVENTAIVYRSGSILYVNRPRDADALNGDPILVTRTTGSSLCSIDIVNLLDRNTRFQRGFVSLGEFVPYRRVR